MQNSVKQANQGENVDNEVFRAPPTPFYSNFYFTGNFAATGHNLNWLQNISVRKLKLEETLLYSYGIRY